MAKKLVVVESPAKAKTIKKYLGRGYTVEASMGHIRDLPKSQLGVNVEDNFEPKYITIRGKGELLAKLRKAAKTSDKVYLATDPDREGEAISWHLSHLLGIKENEPCRIEFNEITKDAVKNAIKNPRPINQNLVDAQQARRILDRLVGYKISPLLWRKVRKGLSAGRVQSVASKIICEREREIEAFKPDEYWNLKGIFISSKNKQSFEAQLHSKGKKKIDLKSKQEVDQVLAAIKGEDYTVTKVQKGSRKRSAPPPFTTSTMQQEASRKLGFTTKKTMMLAQQLYEGVDVKGEGSVGLITYMRTDSTRVSDQALAEVRTIIQEKFGKDYVPSKANIFRSKKGSQDAHEAIRPTSVRYSPKDLQSSLKRDQLRLYTLIYNRFMASQMKPALYETLTVNISAGEYIFRASGSRKVFPGYTALYMEGNDEGKEEKDIMLPDLEEGEKLELKEYKSEQKFTQPPARYTEASLVRALEDMGIGRPSTYAPTISTIISRGYVVRDARILYPTDLGFIVNDLMDKYFPKIMEYKFTAAMEEKLDKIEEGEVNWRDLLNEFYPSFADYLSHAEQDIGKIEIKDEESDVVCEKCGANMVIKTGRYGKFLACPNFPKCRNTKPIVEEINIPCPKCSAQIVVRKSKRGRKFYGCSNYPECDFVSWDMPIKDPCPKCGALMTEKSSRANGKTVQCTNKECGYTKEKKDDDK
ncbi:MAG: type I DNA topoisomerase [Clostridiales bacterium]|nr:type I DNA topoisomerase [Clostridia bacterium]MDI9513063.1 type I DNA topoisomerase [Bacillota bacterium]NLH58333.1 type I DNA topoisomerase [Clostridiales bacterium]